jgi:hypothetical protein
MTLQGHGNYYYSITEKNTYLYSSNYSQGGLTSGRRAVVKTIAESLLQHDENILELMIIMANGGARCPRGQCARRTIAEPKQFSQRPVIRWVIKIFLSRAPPCFKTHVKPLVPAAFAVVSTPSSFKED